MLPVFELGATKQSERYGARQIIAAKDHESARALAKWDYGDETVFFIRLEGVWAEGPERVIRYYQNE